MVAEELNVVPKNSTKIHKLLDRICGVIVVMNGAVKLADSRIIEKWTSGCARGGVS